MAILLIVVAFGGFSLLPTSTGASSIVTEQGSKSLSLAAGMRDYVEVTFLNVGQGDSVWLHGSDGTDVLVDGGPSYKGGFVLDYLTSRGVRQIDVIVLSHADADHCGGLVEVLRSPMSVGAVVYNGQSYTGTTYTSVLSETARRGLTPTPALAGQTFDWGLADVRVANPRATPMPDENDNSVVLQLQFGGDSFVFTGDITDQVEPTVAGYIVAVPSTVLKVAHHGSKFSSSADFLRAVGPDLAVISVSANNSFGHPASETLDRLTTTGARIARTDLDGRVRVRTEGNGIRVWLGDADKSYVPLTARGTYVP